MRRLNHESEGGRESSKEESDLVNLTTVAGKKRQDEVKGQLEKTLFTGGMGGRGGFWEEGGSLSKEWNRPALGRERKGARSRNFSPLLTERLRARRCLGENAQEIPCGALRSAGGEGRGGNSDESASWHLPNRGKSTAG